jgi:hypothetical protein
MVFTNHHAIAASCALSGKFHHHAYFRFIIYYIKYVAAALFQATSAADAFFFIDFDNLVFCPVLIIQIFENNEQKKNGQADA